MGELENLPANFRILDINNGVSISVQFDGNANMTLFNLTITKDNHSRLTTKNFFELLKS